MEPISLPWKTHFYYRNRLNSADREIYDALFEGYASWKTKIQLPSGCNIDQVCNIFSLLMRDYPIFFHVKGTITIREGAKPVLLAEYRLSKQDYAVQYRQVLGFVQSSRDQLKDRIPYEMVRSIHNSIIKHVEYFGKEEPDSHNVTGTILKKKAVCESMAKAFKLICDSCQIPCIVVFGNTIGDDELDNGTGFEQKNRNYHAWNMVHLGKHWYNIDVTYDLSYSEKDNLHIRYDYFCRSDQVFAVEHEPEGDNLPQAPIDYNIYKIKKQYVYTLEELNRYIKTCVDAGKLCFDFAYAPAVAENISLMQEIIKSALAEIPYCRFKTVYNKKFHIATVMITR